MLYKKNFEKLNIEIIYEKSKKIGLNLEKNKKEK